jgi:hypothetical protein
MQMMRTVRDGPPYLWTGNRHLLFSTEPRACGAGLTRAIRCRSQPKSLKEHRAVIPANELRRGLLCCMGSFS